MDNIFKHDILSEVLVRPIQLVSMRFSLYCQNVIGKMASFLLHRLPGRDAGPGGFKALKKKNGSQWSWSMVGSSPNRPMAFSY